jgi:hypothetical protein
VAKVEAVNNVKDADVKAVLRQVFIRNAIVTTVTTIDDRSDRDNQPLCMIQPWLPCSRSSPAH